MPCLQPYVQPQPGCIVSDIKASLLQRYFQGLSGEHTIHIILPTPDGFRRFPITNNFTIVFVVELTMVS